MKQKAMMGMVASLLVISSLGAAATPEVSRPRSIDHRIQTLRYTPDQVYLVRGWVGYHVDLEFEPGESFVTLGSGDIDGLTYGAYTNHLVLKPKISALHTNITVFTTRRTYLIDYTVSAGAPAADAEDLIYVVRFAYPAVIGPTVAERVTEDLKSAATQRTQNRDYWYCGRADLQPIAASDDGVHTRLRFGSAAEMPAIFVRADDGTESLLNYSMDAGDVVIHRLARHFILRRGKLVGCIVNKGFIGAGERLKSGTVSPQVERGTKEIAP